MASSTQLPGLPAGAADPCVHCGFCLPTCASYRVLASEMDSPRGRIHALRAIEAGELELDATRSPAISTPAWAATPVFPPAHPGFATTS